MVRAMGELSVQLRIEGVRCLVVGGGTIATRKASQLIEGGAHVVVVAPTMSAQLHAWAQQQRIVAHERKYCEDDVVGAALIFAATAHRDVNAAIARSVHPPQWVNVVDDASLCTFYSMASVRRGALHVAVGTSGGFPALAAHVRDAIAVQYDEEYAQYVDFLTQARTQTAHLPASERTNVHRSWLHEDVARAVRADAHAAWQMYVAPYVKA
jgi:precorrin-2 dehydrogenase/sirohydrochlorin ferrochelatase